MFNLDIWKKGSLWLPFFLFVGTSSTFAFDLSNNESKRIGQLIFQNECASQTSCLTSWNKGEDFASLGIGHFIWYPEGVKESDKRFDESFPKLLTWMQSRDVEIPTWLLKRHGNPWQDRAYFESLKHTKKMQELRYFLLKTRNFQVEFMKNRLQNALPSILAHIPQARHAHISQQFQYVADSPMGFYALIDYVNFKGEGIKLSERYQEQGWGLLQVLEHMQSEKLGLSAIQAFSASAAFTLTQRVALSPPLRHEERWLLGWKKRIKSYEYEAKNLLANP